MGKNIQQRQQIINYGYQDIVLGLPIALIGLLLSLLLVLGFVKEGKVGLVVAAIFFGGIAYYGYRLIAKGIKGIKLRNAVRQYLNLIINQGKRSLDNIASDLNRSDIQKLMAEVQEVIDLGFLPGMTLDRANRTLDDTISVSRKNELADQGKVKISFSCKPCGANNTVLIQPGESAAECEYCGCMANI